MKTILFFKVLVGIMSILMIIGSILVFVKLADNHAQRKSKTQQVVLSGIAQPVEDNQNINPLPAGTSIKAMTPTETIVSVQPCGSDLCLITAGHPNGYKLIVMQPQMPVESMVLKSVFLQ